MHAVINGTTITQGYLRRCISINYNYATSSLVWPCLTPVTRTLLQVRVLTSAAQEFKAPEMAFVVKPLAFAFVMFVSNVNDVRPLQQLSETWRK